MWKTSWVLLTLLLCSHACDAYRALVIFPVPGKSHNILGNAVVKYLLDAEHEVTYITSTIDKKPHPNLKQVDVSANWNMIPGTVGKLYPLYLIYGAINKSTNITDKKKHLQAIDKDDMFELKTVLSGGISANDNIFLGLIFIKFASETLQNENVQKLLADKTQHFDVIIAEWMYNEIYSGFQAVYHAPLIWVSTMEPHGQVLSLIDEYLNTAYNGCFIVSLPPFSFLDRVRELWQTVRYTIFKETVLRVYQWREYENLIVPHIESRGLEAPPLEVLKYNASLMLGNSHVSLGQATRLPQNYKPIAGYHIPEKTDPLTADLKKIMDESKHGVIYFSMGSNLKSKTFPDKIKQDILKVFASLKQTVLWKFEEDIPNKPKNLHILQWAPQQSILAHPNCVLFITHGGLLSTTETVHAGVPIIGIPVFADQFSNVERAVHKGFAKKVTLSYNMGDELKATIEDILGDPKYTRKVKELSLIYHDRPVKPGRELVHWVEHVIKTNGAPHLRSVALDVPWYQKFYLDLALLLAAILYVLRKLLKLILPKVFSNKTKNQNNKQKKN